MRRRVALAVTLPVLALLAGCASAAGSAAPIVAAAVASPTVTEDADAAAQAQAWLDAATLPPGAARATVAGTYNSYTGWPCGPIVQRKAFWTIADMTVAGAANWLRQHPTADLVTTSPVTFPEDPTLNDAMVGYIPADESQQGVVYTVVKEGSGVAIRAEIAALTDSATCPSQPPGTMLGKPGQG